MKRRDFIKAGAILGISPTILKAVDSKKEEKSCVYIFLGGGISHIEFLNPIPDAPVEYRSVTGAVKTKSGYEIGGSFTNLAKISKLFTSVRSLHHRDGNHYTATHWVNTGHVGSSIPEGGSQKEPSYGSFVAHKFNPNALNGIPNYVKVNQMPHDEAAWLGPKYMGYDSDAEATKNLKLSVSKDKFAQRISMLDKVNSLSFKQGNSQKMFKDWEDTRKTAIDVITGDASKAFDLNLEDEKSKEMYKISSSGFGKSLLQARRLVENGCKFVTLTNNGWDMHQDILEGFKNRAAELDQMLAIFFQDMEERGLLKNTLVVVTSEFGRTVKINPSSGRDHFNSVNSIILAGSGYGDSLIGKTNSKASEIIDKPYMPEDLCHTILHHFGFEPNDVIVDNQKRPRYPIEKDSKLII